MHNTLQHLRSFAHTHDDLPAFHAGYLVLTFLCAVMFPLGAFALLIAAHVALDIVKYRDYHKCTWAETAEGVMRESLVDATLLSVGFLFAVYLHHSVGIASVSGLMRTEILFLQFAGVTIPKITILHHFLKVMSHIHHYLEHVHPRMRTGLSTLEHLCIYFLATSLILLLLSPYLMGVAAEEILAILHKEIAFWRI